jgi:hypothetical protein
MKNDDEEKKKKLSSVYVLSSGEGAGSRTER